MHRVQALAHPARSARRALLGLAVLGGLAMCSSSALAVTFPWVTTSTSTTASYAYSRGVSMLADGTSIITGSFAGTDVDLGDGVPRTSAQGGASYSASAQKLSASGSVLWVRTSTSTAVSDTGGEGISTLADGSSIITGYFQGTAVDLGDGVPRTSAQGGARYSAFTQKLNASGSVLWVRTSTSTAVSTTFGYGVSTLADGSSIITGYFRGIDVDLGDGVPRTSAQGGARYSAFTQKLNASGSVLWVRTSTATAASDAGGYGVSTFGDGRSVVTGFFQGTDVDLGDGVPRTSAEGGASLSAFNQKLNAVGSVLWVRASTSTAASYTGGSGVSTLADGSSIITGFFQGTDVDLGDGVPRTSAQGGASESAFTQKLSASGSVLWVRTSTSTAASDTSGEGVTTLADGSSIITGFFQGTGVDLGDGVPRTSAQGGASYSAFTQKLSAGGSVLWTSTSSTTSTAVSQAVGAGVSALPDGSSVITGDFLGIGINLGDGVPRTSAFAGADYSMFTQEILDAPQAPDAPVAVAGAGSATVTITPLAGGSVTSYAVASSPAGGTCTITAPATSCVVARLAGGTGYTFTARATNAAGEGPASLPSNRVTPTAPLSATIIRPRARMASGQAMRIGIRAANAGPEPARSAKACLVVPANLVVVQRGSARRTGRTWCFAVTAIAPRAGATRYLTVRARSTRTVVRTIAGRVSATGLATATAPSRKVTIVPRRSFAVTG